NDIETPQLPDVAISDSTTKTFSDKLIMFLMSQLMASGLGSYATTRAASQRSDLMVNYQRLSLEESKLGKRGAHKMIEQNCPEQTTGKKDRQILANNKEKGCFIFMVFLFLYLFQ